MKPSAKCLLNSLMLGGFVLASSMWVSGCSVEVQNRQPSRELKQLAAPPGSVYSGWRVFQDKCSACHGPAALGTAKAPNLLPLVGNMGPRQFVSLVLTRYDWNLSQQLAHTEGPAREALLDDVMQRKAVAITMPAWQGEPSVNAHIVDLYAYLSARSQGAQGPGRPAQ